MFRMTISDVFFIKGRGAVATGQIEMGSVRVGDELTMDGGATAASIGLEG
jgi:translation elongation factor EF-Tu-like GTPase